MNIERRLEHSPIPETFIQQFEKYGVGHMKTFSDFNIEHIPSKEREGILEDYELAVLNIKSLIETTNRMIERLDIRREHPGIADDILLGLDKALMRTANQLLYHAVEDPEQSSSAFDELNMLIIVISNYMEHPAILSKEFVNKNRVYHLSPRFENIEHREIEDVNALFSRNNVAWNIMSSSPYTDEPVTHSGIRLDWGPLDKENEDGTIDKVEREWRASYDVSGFNIDKVMNQYSQRGHHFPDVFQYKIGALIPGLAKSMEQYYDNFLEQS
jgi:hypothetical protein